MRTLLLLGVAAGSLLLAGRATSAEVPMTDTQPQEILDQSASYHDRQLEYRVPAPNDGRVFTDYSDRIPSEVDYRSGGRYDAEGRWTGSWNGTYETPDGQKYHGTYEGTYEGRAGTRYAHPPHDANGERGGPPPRGYYQHGYGYGYYSPGVVVTTIITGAPVVTETIETTTRTSYVNVPVRKRHIAKKRVWRAKPKPRCSC